MNRILLLIFVLLFSLKLLPLRSQEDGKQDEQLSKSSQIELLGCNPLQGFQIFAIHPLYSIPSKILQAKISLEIEKELQKIGNVIIKEVPEVTGYAKAEGRLTFVINDIKLTPNNSSSVVETSMSVDSSTLIKKTGKECTTYIWSANSFTTGKLEDKNEANILSSTKQVLSQFIADYQSSNKNQTSKPIFYLYRP